ncbi:hypothetical protein [Shinella sp. DD12]|uniref:hypothetical protein n=1 Tax=Shinella sp. DD12 TaxID=1410620 RepID=UPI0003C57123|nr:hypothetical protein [Shinella sp. DD12]EYR81438.1 hypothetical protein SHLA_15c001230 [Shinella sp. DD12]
MTDLSSIIERVEKATGPDRSIDVEVMNLLCPRPKNEAFLFLGKQLESKWGGVGDLANKTTYFVEAPRLTTSVDAAISLVERVLPGWEWVCGRDAFLGANAAVYQSTIMGGVGLAEDDYESACATPVIALVLATLRALQSKGGEA